MASKVRVRFAPSPTGPLHIGGLRTALYNYLFAKKHDGDFILRIEDTDQNRFVPGAEQYIKDALQWCGITYDEGPEKDKGYGPYKQSERKPLYKQYADELIKKGKAYYAFDTPEVLDNHRKEHEAKGKTFIYNWHNREKLTNSLTLTEDQVNTKIKAGEPYVIRFKAPKEKILELNDVIRGTISIDTNILDDKVLFKSDGMPTYHLANIVDDHLMEITHVIRGEEWLPSLALHHLLYEAFDWTPPIFAHLPLILKPTGKGKLSKRDGEKGGFPIFPLSWNESLGYKEAGYFPEAVVNFLAMLGWNPGTEEEVFSLEQLIEKFSLDRVNKSGARFDPEKNKWYNQQHLQQKSIKELAGLFTTTLETKQIPAELSTTEKATQVVSLVKERASFVSDLWELSNYFFTTPTHYEEKAVKKQWKEQTPTLISQVKEVINNVEEFTSENIESAVKHWIKAQELSFGKVMPPLRLVIVGDMKGPHLFDIISFIGKTETNKRIDNALNNL
ncbi:glutamate--tRNA ligase [Croceivirga sp. JEA036]|uniref:glutamate--tRNA ligase n=1 Tax=Croceivirga sp. JEA036 TaxID=2721162 RepID=UPI00143A6914|nr:glutamate--tRNA ligase [Croceivirga sp. JEA036]NJB37051.1 glutamate--tRNA ligase [Croceivirga sp. JEA036]